MDALSGICKAEIESKDSSDRPIPDAAIYSDTQSPVALNVKHKPEASFTVTTNLYDTEVVLVSAKY